MSGNRRRITASVVAGALLVAPMVVIVAAPAAAATPKLLTCHQDGKPRWQAKPANFTITCPRMDSHASQLTWTSGSKAFGTYVVEMPGASDSEFRSKATFTMSKAKNGKYRRMVVTTNRSLNGKKKFTFSTVRVGYGSRCILSWWQGPATC